MTENDLKKFAGKMNEMKSMFDAIGEHLPSLLESARKDLTQDEKINLEKFEGEARKIQNSKIDVFQKMLKIQQLKEQYGSSNDSK